jgi:hypothetical protein
MNKKFFLGIAVVWAVFLFIGFWGKVFAGPAEYQQCKTGFVCTIGEFLYDDEYNPIATASCHLTARYPDGSVFINAATLSAQTDGWYSYSFETVGVPEGFYRGQLCCDVSPDYLCLDKSFEIGPAALTASEAAKAVWDEPVSSHAAEGSFGKNLQNPVLTAQQIWEYTSRTLTGFGDLVAQIWNYTSRTMTDFGNLIASIWSHPTRTLTSENLENGKKLATNESLKTATESAVSSIKGTENKDLTQINTQLTNIKTTVDAIDLKTNSINTLLTKWGSYSASDIYDKVKDLSSDIAKINNISNSDISEILSISKSNQEKLTDLLNKVLAMQAVLDVNRTLLKEAGEQPVIRVWLEEGSIVFKIMVVNPSSVEKKVVPFKYYLPEELKRENILKVDEALEVNFDPKENSFYVSGEILLSPKETKIMAVEVEDIWKIDKQMIESLQRQTATLFEPLKNTAYFAQASTLKADIDLNLDRAWMMFLNAYTPEMRIKAYRDASKEIVAAQAKIADLKTLASNASSSKSLFASLSGVSVVSVWLIVFIVVAVFIFLLWYLEKNDLKKIKEKNDQKSLSQFNFWQFFHLHFSQILLFFGLGLIVALLLTFVFSSSKKLSKDSSESASPTPSLSPTVKKTNQPLSGFVTPSLSNFKAQASPEAKIKENVLGESEEKKLLYLLIVPEKSYVNLRDLPILEGSVLARIDKNTIVKILQKVPGWYKISFGKEKAVEGWVKDEFIQAFEQ